MMYADTIVNTYRSRAASNGNWAAWATSYPKIAALLAEAEKIANG